MTVQQLQSRNKETGVCDILKGVTILQLETAIETRPASLYIFCLWYGIMTTAHRPTWVAAQAAASDVGNWSTGGERDNFCRKQIQIRDASVVVVRSKILS